MYIILLGSLIDVPIIASIVIAGGVGAWVGPGVAPTHADPRRVIDISSSTKRQ